MWPVPKHRKRVSFAVAVRDPFGKKICDSPCPTTDAVYKLCIKIVTKLSPEWF